MGDALRVDELWEASVNAGPGDAPHLETNKWLAPVFCTTPRPFKRKEQQEIEFLGQRILWTTDRDRPFPAWLADALMELLTFQALPGSWDSYGSRPLQQPAIGPVLKWLIRIHEVGRQATLVPLPDGGVGLRLATAGSNFEIDVGGNGHLEALLDRASAPDVEVGPEATVAEVDQLLGLFVTHG